MCNSLYVILNETIQASFIIYLFLKVSLEGNEGCETLESPKETTTTQECDTDPIMEVGTFQHMSVNMSVRHFVFFKFFF